jgi:membrane associated rhomboid family serine protease
VGNSDSMLPCIGASGGISGVIVFYALQFPGSRLGMFFRWGFFFRWVTFPAWIGIVFWIGMQIFISFLQVSGLSNVAGLAHLGGAAAGLGAWAVHRQTSSQGDLGSGFKDRF